MRDIKNIEFTDELSQSLHSTLIIIGTKRVAVYFLNGLHNMIKCNRYFFFMNLCNLFVARSRFFFRSHSLFFLSLQLPNTDYLYWAQRAKKDKAFWEQMSRSIEKKIRAMLNIRGLKKMSIFASNKYQMLCVKCLWQINIKTLKQIIDNRLSVPLFNRQLNKNHVSNFADI